MRIVATSPLSHTDASVASCLASLTPISPKESGAVASALGESTAAGDAPPSATGSSASPADRSHATLVARAQVLTGAWKLDWSRSEKSYDFTIALGVPLLARPLVALADTMTPVYVFALTEKTWEISGGLTPSVDVFTFGAISDWSTADGSKHKSRLYFDERGDVVIHAEHNKKPLDIVMTFKIAADGISLHWTFALVERAGAKKVVKFLNRYLVRSK